MPNQEKTRLPRRSFLAATAVSAARVYGANERIRCGTIGTGGRGWYLTNQFKEHGAEMAAICDVYEPRLETGLKAASPGARTYIDYRKLLEDKSLDAIVIATPDHLHAQMTVDAAEAGKDIYVEKPLAHTIEAGFRMVEAVRRNKRVAQVGTQRRSYDLYLEAKGIFDSGVTGPVRLINSWWLNSWKGGLSKAALKGKLHWDLFLGGAPKRPMDPVRYFNWLQFRDYSGGLLNGQAAHIIDGIQMMMNSTFPTAVTCTGSKIITEGADNPDTATMTVEYPDHMVVFTLSYKAMKYRLYNDQMQQFHGSTARMDLGRESYAIYQESSAIELKPSRHREAPDTFESASWAHIRNFLECVRSRKDPNATIEMGQHTSVALCMATQSLKAERRVRWNAAARRAEV
jgi:predicted dehydrogenase